MVDMNNESRCLGKLCQDVFSTAPRQSGHAGDVCLRARVATIAGDQPECTKGAQDVRALPMTRPTGLELPDAVPWKSGRIGTRAHSPDGSGET